MGQDETEETEAWKALVGTMADTAIARECGVSMWVVRGYRLKQGIPAFGKGPKAKKRKRPAVRGRRRVEVNINAQCEYVLTKRGAAVWNQYYVDLYAGSPHLWRDYMVSPGPAETKTPLWDLMHIFGPRLINGADACFVRNRITFTEGECVDFGDTAVDPVEEVVDVTIRSAVRAMGGANVEGEE